MDLSVSNFLSGQTSPSLRRAQPYGAPQTPAPVNPAKSLPAAVVNDTAPAAKQTGTRLINETQTELAEGGYRRIRTYEQNDGRPFTKIEELALTTRGARKSVVQQNPSGSITRYEEILDREAGGNFRRTQRFQDETGEVSTNITTGYKVTDPFVLTGGESPASYIIPSPFNPARGIHLDIRA